MARSFYFLSSFSQHLADGAPSASSSSSSFFSNAVSVYQPLTETQIVLPDASRCIAVRAFLRLAGIPFTVAEIPNSHDASPSGAVPFIVADSGSLAVAEWKPIVTWAQLQGRRPASSNSSAHDDHHLADAAIWSNAIDQPLRFAELQVTYEWEENFVKYATRRIGSSSMWPLSWALPKRRREEALSELRASAELFDVQLSSLLQNAERLLTAVSIRLNSWKGKDGWVASSGDIGPTEADCLLYGHLSAILDHPLPRDDLRELVMGKPVLMKFCSRFQQCLQAKAEVVTATTERPPSEHIVIPQDRIRTISVDTNNSEHHE